MDGFRNDEFTAAALRVLQHARQLASQAGRGEPGVRELLRALRDDESHAAELLADAPLETTARDATAAVPELESESVVAVLRRARQVAQRGHARAPIGTEHLLWGVLAGDSPAARALRTRGLSEERIARAFGFADPETGPPLAVDVELLGTDRRERERTATFRILDAAANRAREGLRVVEDHVRFVLDDAHLARLTKELRHGLASALSRLDAASLLHARDTPEDVGTAIATDAESRRASAEDVLRANLKRVQESLRTLEEYGKTLDAVVAADLERLRYDGYTLEKAILTTIAAAGTFADRLLYLLLTRDACRRDPEFVVREALAGGVDVVQVREKRIPDRELVRWGRDVRRWTRERGALLIVNDRPDLAVLVEADGVHVGQDELTVAQARRVLGAHRLVGVSTHDREQARRAVVDGADYLGVGPTFPSGTKTFDAFPGLEFVRATAGEITCPWFPLGGIDHANVSDVVAAGATRVAVCGAICGADDPRAAAASLRARLA